MQVLAHMSSIQIEIAVASLGITPDGPLRNGSPKEGDGAGGDLPLYHAGFGDVLIHFLIQLEGN